MQPIITTDAPGGYYQFPSGMGGSDTAPAQAFLNIFPNLHCDSFVTIGLNSVPEGVEDFTQTDLLVVNPAVPRNSQWLKIADEAGVPHSSEIIRQAAGRLFGASHRGPTREKGARSGATASPGRL